MSLFHRHGRDPAQAALAFVNSRNFVTSNLIGATTLAQVLLAEARQRDSHVVKPGVRALLARLQAQGLPLAVASSTHRAEVELRLRSQDLWPAFSAVAGGEEVPAAKPAPDVYLLAATRLGVDPTACLAFEDAAHGAAAAQAAGMAVVVVPDLVAATETLRGTCLAVLQSLEETAAHHEMWRGRGQ